MTTREDDRTSGFYSEIPPKRLRYWPCGPDKKWSRVIGNVHHKERFIARRSERRARAAGRHARALSRPRSGEMSWRDVGNRSPHAPIERRKTRSAALKGSCRSLLPARVARGRTPAHVRVHWLHGPRRVRAREEIVVDARELSRPRRYCRRRGRSRASYTRVTGGPCPLTVHAQVPSKGDGDPPDEPAPDDAPHSAGPVGLLDANACCPASIPNRERASARPLILKSRLIAFPDSERTQPARCQALARILPLLQ
jgi:hypothetical protein